MDKELNKLRDATVAPLVQIGGFTRADANEAFDLALHAVQEASALVLDICARSDKGQVNLQAALIAGGMLKLAGDELVTRLAMQASALGADVRSI